MSKHGSDSPVTLNTWDQRALCLPVLTRSRSPSRGGFAAGSASRGRFLCTSVCIFLDANAQGRLPRRIRQLTPARTALFHAWVPGYVKFLTLHRGMSKRTLRKTRFVLGESTAFLEAQGLRAWHGLQPTHLHDFGLRAGGRNAITRLAHAGILRRFLRYVYVQGGLERHLPTVVGRQDYAVLLLVARYGLRPSDISRL